MFFRVVAVYLGGLVIGLTLVSFPASSAILREMHGLTDAEYGAIYLPQLIMAFIGAVIGGEASQRLGLKSVYTTAVLAFLAAQLLLAASTQVDAGAALGMVMGATGCFGFGFGFGGGPLNAFAAALSERRSDTTVMLLHMSAGAGLSLGPLYFAAFAERGLWVVSVLALAGATAAALLAALASLPNLKTAGAEALGGHPSKSAMFWAIGLATVLYALAEGTFSNWTVVYVQEQKGMSPETAALALTAFWGCLTVGRLLSSLLLIVIRPIALWFALPPLMAAGAAGLTLVNSPATAIAAFGFCGAACSAFFPLTVSVLASRFPGHIAWIASMLTALLMVGVGIGSYVIGSLRAGISLPDLYLLSAGYPMLAFAVMWLAFAVGRKSPAPRPA
jgi:predicted MFS family arabinose efflux permease